MESIKATLWKKHKEREILLWSFWKIQSDHNNIYFETTFTHFVKTLKIYSVMASHIAVSNPYVSKGLSSQSYGFSISHVWMWELDYKENWALKNWYFWTVALEKTLESPLDCQEIQPVHPKGDQSWVFIGRTNAEAETPILWQPDAKNWLIRKDPEKKKRKRKDPDAGKDWRQEKGMTEDEMVGWHHRLDAQFE